RINNIRPISRADHNHVFQRFYSVKLGEQLAYHSLRDSTIPKTRSTSRNYRVQLIEEDDARSSCPSFPEDLPYRLLRFPNPLAEELRALDRDEVRLALSSHRSRQHGLPTTGGSEEQNPLWSANPNSLEYFRLLQRPFDSLLQLLLHLSQPTDITPVNCWDFNVDLPHRGWRDLSVSVHEILQVDLHLLQNATGYSFFFEVYLRKISPKRLHCSLATASRTVRSSVAVTNVPQTRPA